MVRELAAHTEVDTGHAADPITDGEAILRSETRDISILVARDDVTITRARYAAGQPVAGPHVHHQHTDAFYVLQGELTFQIGRESETVTISPGGFVAVPPGVIHSFRTGGDGPARWLTIHAHDGGFAGFMRGIRNGIDVAWDIAAVPIRGGLPASEATVTQPHVHGWGGVTRLSRARALVSRRRNGLRYEHYLHPLETASQTSTDFAAGLMMSLDETVEYAVLNAG